MELHVPAGTNLIDLLSRSEVAADPRSQVSDRVLDGITPPQLDEAITALVRGDIEYVGLHDGDAFVQVAGSGAGPYLIEHHPAPGTGVAVHVPAGVTDEAVRFGLAAYLARDPDWARPFPWEPVGSPPTSGGPGLFGRLFGRR